MPKIWDSTIEAHKAAVHDAVLDAAASLIADQGLGAVNMAAIARTSGIGRATLYKYFSDIDEILSAWHERQVTKHLELLAAISEKAAQPRARLAAVMRAYAELSSGHADETRLHFAGHVQQAKHHMRGFLENLIVQAQQLGDVRPDVPAAELAVYVMAALDGAGTLPTHAAVGRLVDVTLRGLAPSLPRS